MGTLNTHNQKCRLLMLLLLGRRSVTRTTPATGFSLTPRWRSMDLAREACPSSRTTLTMARFSLAPLSCTALTTGDPPSRSGPRPSLLSGSALALALCSVVRLSAPRTAANNVFNGHNMSIDCDDADDLTMKSIASRLLAAGGAHTPGAYDFGPDQTHEN